jgi:hypothetical protein
MDLAGDAEATPQVRAIAAHQLTLLGTRMSQLPGSTPEDRAHRAAVRRDIERFLDGRDVREARTRPAPIPLPWP